MTASPPSLSACDGPLVTEFAEALRAVGGTCAYAPTVTGAAHAVHHFLRHHALHEQSPLRVGVSPSLPQAVTDVIADDGRLLALDLVAAPALDAARLFALDAGVTGAQWGIAETGTLVLRAGAERNRLLSLVPPIHVALLRAADLLPTCAAVLRVAHRHTLAGGDALTFVTGPSRTSDIELIPVVGVHGPRHLHVVVYDDDTTHTT